MNAFKLVALDLDGTLNNDQKVVTPKTRDALLKVQKLGVIVVLASGRPTPGLSRENQALRLKDHHGVLLSYNGGRVVDVTTGEVLYEKAIPNELAVRLLRHLEKFPVASIVDDGAYLVTDMPNGFKVQYESEQNNLVVRVVKNTADAVDFSPVKVLIAAPAQTLRPLADEIMAPFEEELSFIFSAPFYLEATMKGIHKADSLKLICEKLGVAPEEVLAFGDAENDLSMLRFAGRGVAMANACQALKDAADEVTLSNNEDGIAYTLSKYFDEISF